ncbi:aggregation-promoting factor C-terminal-like domain-containing protein [Williamsia sterculiae]
MVAQTAPEPVQALRDAETDAKAFIFEHESGGRLDAVNAESSACGLGQSLPCAKLASVCPDWRTNRDCQLAYWESYMLHRYGSWTRAKAHWVARVPINGRDCGNWW